MLASLSYSLRQQDWLQLSPAPTSLLPRQWRNWVLDPGSLTKRLKALQCSPFSVALHHVGYGRATLSEAKALNIAPRHQVYVREVTLMVAGIRVVRARSVIPRATLTGPERQLLHLGTKPLGEFLFTHPKMVRGPIQFKQGRIDHREAWARRSVFYLNDKPLLVSEVFLPELLQVE